MKNIIKALFYLLAIGNIKCREYNDSRLGFYNNSKDSIYLTISYDTSSYMYNFNPKTAYNVEGKDTFWLDQDFFVPPRKAFIVPCPIKWEDAFENCPDKRVYIYFFNLVNYKKVFQGKKMAKNQLYEMRSYTLSDFEKMEWHITYP
jgi:hypothetical protein